MKYSRGKSQDLWKKAKRIIPGGGQLLSKRAEMFLPDAWPAYFKKAKGARVTDLDGRHYLDFGIFGIGSCVLGYADPTVNAAVKRAVNAGNMCTLNSPEEVELAEMLIERHPGSGMARFTRSGGEACAVAIRIARAHTRRDKVLFCGYHGWSDWYLASNLADATNLSAQLLPGLDPAGVPQALAGTAVPFRYGETAEFRKKLSENAGQVGAVIMEVERHKDLDLSFLREIARLARASGAVLIYDEITSGFRRRAGGLHVLHGLTPDLTVLGKAMGNGFAISAVVGRSEVMQAAQRTFISSTYWTERVGFAAACETIRQFEKRRAGAQLNDTGAHVMRGLRDAIAAAGLAIDVVGLHASPTLLIREEKPVVVKTLYIQEMLKRGILASTVMYLSLAHTKPLVRQFLTEAAEVFELIANAKKKGTLEKKLEGPACHTGFQRLN